MAAKFAKLMQIITASKSDAIKKFFKSLVIIIISPFIAITLLVGGIFADGIAFNHQLVSILFEGGNIGDLVQENAEYLMEIEEGLKLIDDQIDAMNNEFENGATLNVYQVKGYFIGFMMSSQRMEFDVTRAELWVQSFAEGEDKKTPTSVNSVIYRQLESNLGITLDDETREIMEQCYASLIGNEGQVVTTLSKEEMDKLIQNLPAETTELRKKIVIQAADAVGKIPYYWGGTASHPGYDGNNFGTAVSPDNKGRNRKGLDCSHFVDWVYWTVMDNNLGNTNTKGQIKMCKKISEQELLPGDLAFLIDKQGQTTHVGIYAGTNENGEKVWIHENANDSNVAMNTVSYWSGYYRLNIMEGR